MLAGKERTILQYVALMLDVYQVCHSVCCCVKMGVVFHRAWSESMDSNAEISYCPNNC